MIVINQLSLVLGLIIAGLILALVLWRLNRLSIPVRVVALSMYVLGSVLFVNSVRYDGTTQEELTTTLQDQSSPVLVMFYSDYCAGCKAMQPMVNQLDEDLAADDIDVVYIDVFTNEGRSLFQDHGGHVTPTFILLDEEGGEAWRGNLVPSVQDVHNAIGG